VGYLGGPPSALNASHGHNTEPSDSPRVTHHAPALFCRFPSFPQTLTNTLRMVATDPSCQPLSAHLCALFASEVNASLRSLERLSACLRLLGAMLRSLSLVLEPYLHQLMPAVLTCLVGKRLCSSPLDDHWSLRHHAASLIGIILRRYRDKYVDLQPRVCKTLLDALADAAKPLSTHYGALVGLCELGPHVVHSLLMHQLPGYLAPLASTLADAPAAATSDAAASKGAVLDYAALRKRWVAQRTKEVAEAIEAEAEATAEKLATTAAAKPAAVATAASTPRDAQAAKAAARRLEALRVHGAALQICGTYLYRHGHLFSLSAPAESSAATATSAAHMGASGVAAAAAAAGAGGKTVPPPPPSRSHRKGAGATFGSSAAMAADAGGAAGGGPSTKGAEPLLPQIATRYDALQAEFGAGLTAYTWHTDWNRRDAPGLLHALL
jgi:hypothetical protein